MCFLLVPTPKNRPSYPPRGSCFVRYFEQQTFKNVAAEFSKDAYDKLVGCDSEPAPEQETKTQEFQGGIEDWKRKMGIISCFVQCNTYLKCFPT